MPNIKKEAFLSDIKKTYEEGYKLILAKNKDYAGDNDPYQNFRNAEVVGVGIERAILVRIMDKISRIGNVLDAGTAVKSESIDDTLMDLINYSAILKAYIAKKGT